MEYPKNSSVMGRRLISERRLLREQHLQQYKEMKPVLKQILGSTARMAGKMMKLLVKTAFRIPGLVKRTADAARRREVITSHSKEEGIVGRSSS